MLKYGNKELALLQDVYYECNYQYNSPSFAEWYEAEAEDSEGNRYCIKWYILPEWQKANNTARLDCLFSRTDCCIYITAKEMEEWESLTMEEIDNDLNMLFDESNACDWGNPDEIILIESAY